LRTISGRRSAALAALKIVARRLQATADCETRVVVERKGRNIETLAAREEF
jgi:hypothetical protein